MNGVYNLRLHIYDFQVQSLETGFSTGWSDSAQLSSVFLVVAPSKIIFLISNTIPKRRI